MKYLQFLSAQDFRLDSSIKYDQNALGNVAIILRKYLNHLESNILYIIGCVVVTPPLPQPSSKQPLEGLYLKRVFREPYLDLCT